MVELFQAKCYLLSQVFHKPTPELVFLSMYLCKQFNSVVLHLQKPTSYKPVRKNFTRTCSHSSTCTPVSIIKKLYVSQDFSQKQFCSSCRVCSYGICPTSTWRAECTCPCTAFCGTSKSPRYRSCRSREDNVNRVHTRCSDGRYSGLAGTAHHACTQCPRPDGCDTGYRSYRSRWDSVSRFHTRYSDTWYRGAASTAHHAGTQHPRQDVSHTIHGSCKSTRTDNPRHICSQRKYDDCTCR